MQEDRYENTSIYLSPSYRKILDVVSLETGLPKSKIVRLGLDLIFRELKKEIPDKYKELMKYSKIREEQSESLLVSKTLMAREGWDIRIQEVIDTWIIKYKKLPSKALEAAWVKNGVALGWSKTYAYSTVHNCIGKHTQSSVDTSDGEWVMKTGYRRKR